MNESDTVDHIMSCKQPNSFRGERFVPLEGEQMKTTSKKEKVEEEKPNKLMKNLNSLMKNASSELARLTKSTEEEDEDAQFVCMICGKKLSAEKMQNHTKHCKVPKGFKGSQFMLLESDELRMKQQEEEKPAEEVKKEVEEKPAEEEKKEAEEKPAEEEKPTAVNPFDAASEREEEGGNPFGAPEEKEEKKEEEKPVEEKKEEEKPAAVNPFDAPSEEEKPTAVNPFDAASESEEGNQFGAPEEKEEKVTSPMESSENEESEKTEGKMRFGLNSLMKNATKSLARLTKSTEEEDEDAQFVCMICGKKLSAEKMQNHTKHCKVPKGFKGSQFMLLESDELRMKQQEEEKPAEEEKPTAVNPFDAASESEEGGNPFGAPEEKEEKPTAVNPFDAASESEEEGGNPFGAPEEKEEEKPAAVNPFDAPSEEEDADPAPLEQTPSNQNFLSKSKKQKSIFNIFRRDTGESKPANSNIFSSLTQSISSTVSNIVSASSETEEEAQARRAREEEERIKREEAERLRREEEERIRKEREEAERRRREEEERIRKKAMMEQKLTAGIACKKYCSRGKPHATTISLITHASKGQMVREAKGCEQ